ncbi:hypothetical protein EN981_03805 [Mesorhizobium sp. M7A.F.Ca.CA.001.13.2.1]|nr:hypothetical protein EN981_03805 [Mesorhizobium sp. M7A.F.Ca.CA.001.13.2.1]
MGDGYDRALHRSTSSPLSAGLALLSGSFRHPRHPNDLPGHDVIRYRFPGSQRLPLTFNVNDQVVRLDPPPRLVFDDNHHFDFAVRSGLGIAQLYRATEIPAIEAGELVELLTEFEPGPVQFKLYYPTRNQPPKLRAFIEWFCG